MERMNEILARAASRRISTRRASNPAPSTPPTTAGSSAPRHTAPRRLATTQTSQANGKPAGPAGATPTRRTPADAATEASQSTRPDADVLESDRILELPARAPTGIVRQAGARRNEMTSLREIAPTYAVQLGPRRPERAASATSAHATLGAPSTGNSSSAADATPLSNTHATKAQGGRTAPSKNKAGAPGVCPLCHGAGYVRLDVPVGDPAFGQAIRCQCKEQQIKERDRLNLRNVSNLDPFRDKTFESFDSKRPGSGIQEAYKEARNFAKDPLGWLIFRGGYGCGKTHLAAAIANAAEKNGIPVIFAIVPELLDHLRATFAPSSDTPYDALFDKIREVNLLVLDDFGAENGTAWATEKLFQLINYRYNYGMPTVITTNDRLLSRVDERISSRLFDQSLVRHVIIEAKDYRRYQKSPATRGARQP